MDTVSLLRIYKAFIADQNGVSSIEYALLGTLVAVFIIGGATAVGTQIGSMFTLVSNCFTFVVSGTGSCA